MSLLLMLPVFLLGLAVGSFVNVLIYRTISGDSPMRGRSYCDHCKRQLSWYENIPLLSYVVLKGRCRTCKKKIPWTYPVVEAITGLLFLWWVSLGFAFFQLTLYPLLYLQPLFWLLVGVLLIVVFFADVLYGIIPDFAVFTLTVASVVYRSILVGQGAMKISDFRLALVSGLVAFALFLLLFLGSRGRGIGFGDVKFSFVMGFLLGFPKSLVGFFLSFVLGGLVGSVMLLVGKKKFGQTLPFGPFLVAGLVVSLLWGDVLWRWYMGLL